MLKGVLQGLLIVGNWYCMDFTCCLTLTVLLYLMSLQFSTLIK